MLHGKTTSDVNGAETQTSPGVYQDTKQRLFRLASAMTAKTGEPSKRNAGIPAGYTYLGQFIAHDLAFHDGRNTSFERNGPRPSNGDRTAFLDLDSLYGGGPVRSPHLYEAAGRGSPLGQWRFSLNPAFTDKMSKGPTVEEAPLDGGEPAIVEYYFHKVARPDADLARRTCPFDWSAYKYRKGGRQLRPMDSIAAIADPRNDENLLISQLLVALKRFHNRIGDELIASGLEQNVFPAARGITTLCYREILIRDFLGRLVEERRASELVSLYERQPDIETLKKLLPFAFPSRANTFRAPDAFWAAAFRVGHQMVQDRYVLNEKIGSVSIREAVNHVKRDLSHLPLKESWVVDMEKFFFTSTDADDRSLNFARPFTLVSAFEFGHGGMPDFKADDEAGDGLIYLDLARELSLRAEPGGAGSVESLLRKARRSGTAISSVSAADVRSSLRALRGGKLAEQDLAALSDRRTMPLLVYLLIEAERLGAQGSRLGPLGSRIIGDTITAAILADPTERTSRTRAQANWERHFTGKSLPTSMPELIAFS